MCDQKSIYIHIPFCVKKCVYCDFFSRTDLSLIPIYIHCLQKEIEKKPGAKENINTIYFGGGTPSLLSIRDVARILQTIGQRFKVSRDVEITFEVNPGTIDFDYLAELKKTGINRLSIGVQSFNDDKLKFLGRIHTAEQAEQTVEDAWAAGFNNISMDFIYGLPFETHAIWIQDLEKAIRMAPSHLSCYMLTIEPGTPLGEKCEKGLVNPLGSSVLSAMFKKTATLLSHNKYEHYEISNFSNAGQNRSRHNSNYWNMTPYYGFGPAAHSYDGKIRSWNLKNLETYIKDLDSGMLPVKGQEILTCEQEMMEMIMLRLRTLEGLDIHIFQARFQVSFKDFFKDVLAVILDQDLGRFKGNCFALTLEGKIRLDSIVEGFAKKIL
ncbi:radical SAM family heme chaperone HemW [Desulfobacula sp.]